MGNLFTDTNIKENAFLLSGKGDWVRITEQ